MKLLVSVRSATEAEAALAGGAALIDVKEPRHGSLGFAGARTIAAVVRGVGGRCPVSAALGELAENHRISHASLAFAKWGLAGCRVRPHWPDELRHAASLLPPGCRPVAVAYADTARAQAPALPEVCAFACSQGWGAFLIDTWRKDGTTLLDWLSVEELRELRARCRAAELPMALAGSLGVEEIGSLRALRPDWFAVRGAACSGGQRTGAIDTGHVRRLVNRLAEPITLAIRAG
jgi:uncharacterized protein (UPF0264 family)